MIYRSWLVLLLLQLLVFNAFAQSKWRIGAHAGQAFNFSSGELIYADPSIDVKNFQTSPENTSFLALNLQRKLSNNLSITISQRYLVGWQIFHNSVATTLPGLEEGRYINVGTYRTHEEWRTGIGLAYDFELSSFSLLQAYSLASLYSSPSWGSSGYGYSARTVFNGTTQVNIPYLVEDKSASKMPFGIDFGIRWLEELPNHDRLGFDIQASIKLTNEPAIDWLLYVLPPNEDLGNDPFASFEENKKKAIAINRYRSDFTFISLGITYQFVPKKKPN